MDRRCWFCGAEPNGTYELGSMETAGTVSVIDWPAGADHLHALAPPTPEELAEEGYESLMRIKYEWMGWLR